MANEQVARLVLRYLVDQASLKQSLAANATLSKSVTDVGKAELTLANTSKLVGAEIEGVGRSKQFDAIALSFAKGDINAQQLVRTLQNLKATQAEIRGVVQESDRLSSSLARARLAGDGVGEIGGGGRGGLRGGRLGRIGSELRMLPSIQIPGAGIGTDAVANVIRLAGAGNALISGVGASMAALIPVAGAVVLGIGAVIAVFSVFNTALEANKKRAEDFGNALSEAFRAGTTTAIQELQRQKQIELESAQATKAVLEQRAEDARQQLAITMENLSNSLANTFEQTGASLFGYDPKSPIAPDTSMSVESYNEQIAAQQAAIESAEIALEAYNLVMGSSTPATRDAEEAEQRLADARRDAALATAEAARSDANEVGDLLRGTGEQALSRRTQLEDDARGIEAAIRSLQRSGETGEEVTEQLEQYRTELANTRSDIATITRLLPQIRFQETVRGAPEALAKMAENVAAFNAEVAKVADARKLSADRDQFDFITQRTRALADFARSQATAETKQVERESELRARIAEIDSEADDQAKERTAGLNKELQQLARDHQDRILQITADGQEAVGDAIAGRNSQAALRAQRDLAKSLDRENAEYDKQKAQREQDFAAEEAARQKQANARRDAAVQALADAQVQYAQERELRQEEFDLRIARENEDRKLRMDRLAEDQRLEDQARLDALNKKQADLLKDAGLNGQFLNNLTTTMQLARDTILGSMQSAAQAISSIQIQVPQVRYDSPDVRSLGAFGRDQVSTQSTPFYSRSIDGAYYNGRLIPRFADGGITGVNRPLMGIVGDNPRFREAVIPLRPNVFRDLGVGVGGGGGTVIQLNVGQGAVNVTARDNQNAQAVATEVVTQFGNALVPRIMKVIEERTG